MGDKNATSTSIVIKEGRTFIALDKCPRPGHVPPDKCPQAVAETLSRV